MHVHAHAHTYTHPHTHTPMWAFRHSILKVIILSSLSQLILSKGIQGACGSRVSQKNTAPSQLLLHFKVKWFFTHKEIRIFICSSYGESVGMHIFLYWWCWDLKTGLEKNPLGFFIFTPCAISSLLLPPACFSILPQAYWKTPFSAYSLLPS